MESNPPGLPELTGGAPLYRRPEPLNPVDHGKLGLLRTDVPYNFASKQHFIPLTLSEFASAAVSYPVVFAGEERTPIAVMGLKQGENLFIPEAVNRGECYNPAYVRRYPFIVANSSDPDNLTSVVCIDRDSDLVGEDPVQPFFTNGAYSEYTKNCMNFCQAYEADRMTTLAIVARLKELDLFEFRTASYTPGGEPGEAVEPIPVAGYFAISPDKLNDLPVETYIQLRDQGVLVAIMAHWISQNLWDRVVLRALRRDAEVAEAAGQSVRATAPMDASPPAPPPLKPERPSK